MVPFIFPSVAQRVKARRLQKEEMARAQYHSLEKNVEEKAVKSDSRRRVVLKNMTEKKGSSKNVNSGEKSKVSKRRKRWNEGISIGGNKRRQSRKKMESSENVNSGEKSNMSKKRKRRNEDISSASNKRRRSTKKMEFVFEDSDDEIEIVGQVYCNHGWDGSLDHDEDEIQINGETNVDSVQECDDRSSSHDSEGDDLVFLGGTYPNTLSSDKAKYIEISSEQNSEETDKVETIQSDFVMISGEEDIEETDENGNDNAGTSKLKSSASRRAGKEPLELEDETSFDCSNESLPAADAENDESDASGESIPSSDSEPDDSDDKDFNIEHYNSPVSKESLSSFENESDTIESSSSFEEESDTIKKVDEQSVEEGTSYLHVCRSESYGGKRKISVSILQEPSGRDSANVMPEIHEETKGQKENLCCVGVEDCSRSSVVKSISSGKNSRIDAYNLQESSERESVKAKYEIHKESEEQKENPGHDTVEEVECPRKMRNKKLEDLLKSTKLKPVKKQVDCARERVDESLWQNLSCTQMKEQKRTERDEYHEMSKKNHAPNDELSDNAIDKMFSEGKGATISKEARKSLTTMKAYRSESCSMRVMVETSGHHKLPRPEASNHSTGSQKENDYGFSNKTNQMQKKNHLSRALIDSMLGRCVLKEKSCEPEAKESIEPEGQQPSSTECSLPLKFRFEDEESKPVEKSEYEKMEEDLFSEMYKCMHLDMDNDTPKDVNGKPNACNVEENQLQSCREGRHDLIIQEDIGEACRHCNHVEREMKHILPDFAKLQRSWGRKYVDEGQFSGFSAVTFSSSVDNFGKSFNGTDGTVWDMIPGAKETMYQHQQEGFEFLWKNLEGTIDLAVLKSPNSSNVGGCIISHAPGTGKTRLTIVFIETYLKLFPDARPVIIAPASMLLTWEEEFAKWNVEFPFHNLNNLELSGKELKKLLENISLGKSRVRDIRLLKMYKWSKEKSVLGVSYQLYEKLAGERHRKGRGSKKGQIKVIDEKSKDLRKVLLELPRLVVLDEGHTPRNQRSCIWNTLLKLQTERRIILSGTPFQNNFGELFNTLHLVRPTIAKGLAREKTFAEMIPRGRYQRKKYRESGTSSASSRTEEVEKVIEKLKERMAPFVHLHKGNILQESLPGLRDCVVLLNPPPQQKCFIEKIERTRGTFEYEHKVALLSVHPSLLQHCKPDKENSNVDLEMLTRLRGNPNAGVKTRFIMELVSLSKASNEKVLIFSQFIETLNLIKDQFIGHFKWEDGKQVFQIQGKLDQKQRMGFMKIFNDLKSEAQVLLASTKCCSEGINLVGASRIVLLDVVWNPSVERQAISRAYRLGQRKVVFTYHLMTRGTTEADKYCRQAEKDRLSELVFSSGNKENDKNKNPSSVFDDRILEEMVDNANLKDMFEKIIYQPKEVNLVETFGSAFLL